MNCQPSYWAANSSSRKHITSRKIKSFKKTIFPTTNPSVSPSILPTLSLCASGFYPENNTCVSTKSVGELCTNHIQCPGFQSTCRGSDEDDNGNDDGIDVNGFNESTVYYYCCTSPITAKCSLCGTDGACMKCSTGYELNQLDKTCVKKFAAGT